MKHEKAGGVMDYWEGQAPAAGAAQEVLPGIFWIRMPLPIRGLETINLWLLRDGDGWTLIDTGLGTGEIHRLWEQIFATVLAGAPIKRVICTHFHPDHTGQAGWIVERFGAAFHMSAGEWSFGRMLWLDSQPEVPAYVLGFLRRQGWDEAALAHQESRGYNMLARSIRQYPHSFTRLADGQRLDIGGRCWRVMVGRGHSPEHCCLYDEVDNILISGDQILPAISPHIGVYPSEPDADPLGDYLSSLKDFARLPDDCLVLPAHGHVFRGLGRRIRALQAHHRERVDAICTFFARPAPAVACFPALFARPITDENRMLATAEALAHINRALREGRLKRDNEGDVTIYQAA